MNTKPSLRLINDGDHFNSEYLAAIMTWPDDFSRGNHFTEASIKNLMEKYNQPETASILSDYHKEIEKALWPGFVSGQIFIATMYNLSLGKAQFLTSNTLDRTNFDGVLRTLSLDSARNHWRKYKNVSHLWAAYLMLNSCKEMKDPNLLVQLAGSLLEKAVKNGGFPNWEPLIVETDTGPFKGEISIPQLPDHLFKMIEEDYTPHSKS